MSRIFALQGLFFAALVWLGGLAWAGLALAQTEPPGAALSRAMAAMADDNWAKARIEARRGGPVAQDIVTWHALREGRGNIQELQDFLARNGDWPGLPYLRQRSEISLWRGASNDDIIAYFADQGPRTGAGALALARAYRRTGDAGAAQAEAVLAWRTLALTRDERQTFLEDWDDLLSAHHQARLDMALWKGWVSNANAMLPLVGADWRALAEARLALRTGEGGVDRKIAAIPEALMDHPGLAYDRFHWRMRRGRTEDAIALLLDRSKSAEKLGEAWAWAGARRDLARERMRDGKVLEAYRIAASHYLVEGQDFADLEWLSGYLALRYLDRADLAVLHFQRFRDAVWTPISVGRAGYWLGRAFEARGLMSEAAKSYSEAAGFQTSFYGLLAAEKAGIEPDFRLAGQEEFPDWRSAGFARSSVFKAAELLLAAGQNVLAERFLTHLAESQDRTGMGQIGAFLVERDLPHIQVMLGKRAASFGIELPGPYFALHKDITGRRFPVPQEMVLAIARRESEFDPSVISGAGARGFMQLMPNTARLVSDWLEVEYDLDKLLNDPVYNSRLGGAYLADLSKRFGGNAVMMAAGYNAGPGRPVRWMDRFGDPRKGEVDIVDWIEFIPFDETRNYVMRVTESLPVYRARLGRDPHPVPFSQELTGATLRVLPDPPDLPGGTAAPTTAKDAAASNPDAQPPQADMPANTPIDPAPDDTGDPPEDADAEGATDEE